MKEKNLYSQSEREVIERQFTNYFLQSLYYARIDYFRKENLKADRVKEILTDDIEIECAKQLNNEFINRDIIMNHLCQYIDVDFIDNEKIYEILLKFSELDIKVLNLLLVNGNTQKEIAEYLNISQPRVSAIKKKYYLSLEN